MRDRLVWLDPIIRHTLPPALVLILCSAAGPFSWGSRAPTLSWEPDRVALTIGDASGATRPSVVHVTSAKTLEDVRLSVVPELEPFVKVTPTELSRLEAGVPYPIRLDFSIPPDAVEGLYEGVVQVRAGRRVLASPLPVELLVEYGNVVVQPDVTVGSRRLQELLEGVSVDGRDLLFGTGDPEIAALVPGSVLVLPPGPTLLAGFLGRVLTNDVDDDGGVVTTEPATLEDVFVDLTVDLEGALSPADVVAGSMAIGATPGTATLAKTDGLEVEIDVVFFDLDGNLDTDNDQVRLNGDVVLRTDFDFVLEIRGRRVRYARFGARIDEQASLVLSASLNLSDSFERDIATWRFQPILIWAGFVPIVLVPRVDLEIGAEGELSIGLETGIEQQAYLTAGVEFADSAWGPFEEHDISFDFSPPQVSATARARGYAGPELSLLLYGALGPYVENRGFLELDADLHRTPLWCLEAGFEVNAGFSVTALGTTLADYRIDGLIDLRRKLAQGGSGTSVGFFDDFNDGNFTADPRWEEYQPDDRPGLIEVIDSGDPALGNAFHIIRTGVGGNGGNDGIQRDIDVPVDDDTRVAFDARVVYRSVVNGCGFQCGEFPVNVSLLLELADGREVRLIYALNYGGAIQDYVDATTIRRAYSVPRDEWGNYNFRIRDEWPSAVRATWVQLRASGWDFESWMDNISIGKE